MNSRIILINYIRNIAEKLHYTCYEGFIARAGTEIGWFPAIWITPPKLIGVEGRQERKIQYRTSLLLLQLNDRYNEQQKNAIWAQMEQDAISLFTQLAEQDRVNNVSKLSCKPEEFAHTGAGELSLNIEFDAELLDCNCQNATSCK